MMNREEFIQVIESVQSTTRFDEVHDVYEEIKLYITLSETYDYHVVLRFMETYYSGKLAGIPAYINGGIDALKLALRLKNKQIKNKL